MLLFGLDAQMGARRRITEASKQYQIMVESITRMMLVFKDSEKPSDEQLMAE